MRGFMIRFASAAIFMVPVASFAQSAASSPSPTTTSNADVTSPSAASAPDSTSPAGQASTAPSSGGTVTVGQLVRDTKGAPVGRIESVSGSNAVLATSNSKVTVPVNSFALQEGGLVFAMSAAEVDAAAKAQKPGS